MSMSPFAFVAVVMTCSLSAASRVGYFHEHSGHVSLVQSSAPAGNVDAPARDAPPAPHPSRSTWASRHGYKFMPDEGPVEARARATEKPSVRPDAVRSEHNLRDTYIATAALVAAVITFIYIDKGAEVIAGILAYLFALATMKIVVKWVFAVNGFQYPVFLTGTHMLASALVGFAILARRALLSGGAVVVPTGRELCFKFLPLSSCIAGSIGAGNISLVYCSASFAEIVAATTPIVTVGMVLLMGLPFDFRLIGPTVVVVLGCTLSVVGEVNFSPVGFVLCVVANVLRAVKVVLQQELMAGETRAKFDPCATLAWMCTCSFVVVLIWSVVSEGSAPYRQMFVAEGFHGLVGAILASCMNAVVLNLAALYVTKHLGAVGGQLVAQAKAALTILGGMAVFHESLSAQEGLGFVCALLGTFLYSRTEQRIKREAAEAEPANLAITAKVCKA